MSDATEKSLCEAMRAQLADMVSSENFDQDLLGVARFAEGARQLLMTIRVPPVGQRTRVGPPGTVNYGNYNAATTGTFGYDTWMPAMPAGAAMGPPEQFGAQAIRQLVALLPDVMSKRTPTELLRAMKDARDMGLNDVAEELRKELLGKDREALSPTSARSSSKSKMCECSSDHHEDDCPVGVVIQEYLDQAGDSAAETVESDVFDETSELEGPPALGG